jgi:branched-chain amino acid transport system ATP-binding protein
VSFGGNHVLRGLDFDVTEHFTGLIGPNGAGKTTLFNAISGYVRPSAGTISIDGNEVTALGQAEIARRGVGRTFQTPKLIGDLSVRDNVLIGMDGRTSMLTLVGQGLIGGTAARARRRWADEVLERFALGSAGGRRADALPLGSQKLVEVCRALVAGPSLLLLDEPAAGLGRDDVENLLTPLRDWVREHGTTVVIIEHDLELVTNLCEDVAVLHLGAIIARGTPADCLRDPDVITAYLGDGLAARP